MAGIQQLLLAAKPAIVSDPNFEYTTLLLPGNGTNGAQNNTFLDSSTNNFTITRNGNTTQGTFSPFSQTGWGAYFDGSGDYLVTPSNAALSNTLLANDFTIETWLYLTAAPSGGAPIWTNSVSNSDGFSSSYVTSNLAIGTGQVGVNEFASANNVLALNQWNHFACVRNGSTVYIYVNGTQVASGAAATYLNTSATKPMTFGQSYQSSPAAITGYFSNIRVVSSAVYTANFTPPTAPLTAITNTQLLTCQSNRFVDNSSNAFAITRNGDVSVQAFSPFNPTAAWDAATYGGSGYFDGSGDYLTAPDNAALNLSGDFTVEAWVYVPNVSGEKCVFHNHTSDNNGIALNVNSAAPRLLSGSGSWDVILDSSIAISANSWNHIAGTRSGNTYTIWVNGQSGGTATSSATPTYSGGAQVGRFTSGVPLAFSGYTANVRVVKGTAVYTTAFTPPTAPLTAITNTSLLLNYTNAGIYDATSKNDLETVGNAQISTAQSKFGGSSIYLDGTGDYVVEPINLNYGYGTGDFTIEFWLYLNATSTQTIVSNLSSASSTNPHLYINTTIRYYTAGADRITGASLSTGVWYHIALCRASGSTRLFVDGTQSGSTYSDTNDYGSSAPFGVGTYWSLGSPVTTSTLSGYIDDLRITKGIARYTANFTPPTAAFPLL